MGVTTSRRHDVREGWEYPIVEIARPFDGGARVGFSVLLGDGSIAVFSLTARDLVAVSRKCA